MLLSNHTSDTPVSLDANKDQQASNKIKPAPGVLIKTNESNNKHNDTIHKINKPNSVNVVNGNDRGR